MGKINSLRDVIGFNSSFKTAINLYLNMNKPDRILDYIPTKSSVTFMLDYLKAVTENKEQATLLVGPYGKGKSHLLLVLLAVLSLERNDTNKKIIDELIFRVESVDEAGRKVAEEIKKIWECKRFLPVLITDTTGDINQAFLYGLNDALKRGHLADLSPDTYFSVALDRIKNWRNNYKDTYDAFELELFKYGKSIATLKTELKLCNRSALEIFKEIYPMITAGSEFNPMTVSEVLPLYKSVSERLVEDYGYSGIYIVFDEFSKFIESQNGISGGNNMKLLQDICELSTESNNAQVFITMVAHKSIKEYGKYLAPEIINAFTGIEGRIIEKYFVTSSKNNYELIKNAIIKDDTRLQSIPHYEKMLGNQAFNDFYRLPAFRSNFQENDFENIILKGCFPLNPIAAFLLLNISEKVAQNERTLFTFISNDEPYSMARFVAEHTEDQEWSIGADLIYDYFKSLFKKEVSNEYVHNIWLSAEYTLDKCKTDDQKKLVKALAIVLIVNKEDEIPADDNYLKLCVNADDCAQALSELIEGQFISKKNATGTYIFKTKAGFELKSEIRKQRELRGDNVKYAQALSDVTGKYYVVPRRYNTLNRMTRYFENEFMHVEDFLNISSAQALLSDMSGDGKVISLYSFSAIKQDLVIKHLEKLADKRIVVVCPKKALKAQKQLRDFEIIQELRDNQTFTNNNEILKKELPLLLDDLTVELEGIISSIYEDDKATKNFYFDGKEVSSTESGDEETAVNKCCELVYSLTPIINNEMVNRNSIGTAQTKKARANIVQAILEHKDDEKFYSGSNQEATIYRSLFHQTKLLVGEHSDELKSVINDINNFIDSCSDCKKSLKDLIDQLTGAPYGMRLGVIPIYLAYTLSKRREDIIVYFAEKEVQLNADMIINMCESPSDYKLYVSKEDLQKEKYISELNVLFNIEDNRNLSTNRIKDILICMQRWFRALPQASRNLVDIDRYVQNDFYVNAMKIMKRALLKVEFNSFEILFVVFKEEFNTNSFEETYKVIDDCKTYYDDYFDWLKAEAAAAIFEVWGLKKKQDLYHLLKEWYDGQSKRSKQGLYSGRTTNFMSCIETLSVYNDAEVAMKIVKSVTDVYMEDWNANAIEDFKSELDTIKQEIESIRDEAATGEMKLTFTGRNGNEITKLYSHVSEGTGSVLRNIIEDTLDEYDDLSVNDRVSILLEMVEKIISK